MPTTTPCARVTRRGITLPLERVGQRRPNRDELRNAIRAATTQR